MALSPAEVLNDAHADALRERTEAERRLTQAVRTAQRALDSVMNPAEFQAEEFASAAVAVLEAEAQYKAAGARCSLISGLRIRLS